MIRFVWRLGILALALCGAATGHAADAPPAAKKPPLPATTAPATTAPATTAPATTAPATGANVAALAKAAATGPAKAREDAIDDLADLGPKAKAALPQLIAALKATEPSIRWRAARALAAIGPAAAAAAAPLAAALDDADPHVRSHAAYALGALGDAGQKYVPALVARVTDEDPHVRRAAIRAIGAIHPDPEQVVTAISASLSAADPSVALAAVRSLVDYGQQSLPAAIQVLRDAAPKSKARYWACVLLAAFGPEAAEGVEPLSAALADEDPGIRMQAALALGQIGPGAKSAVPALIKTLDDPLVGVRYTAAYALGLIGDKSALTALKKASLGKDTLLKTLSIWAIAKAQPENTDAVGKAIDAIIAAMADQRPEVRQAAAQALWDLKAPHEKLGPALAAALNDENPEVVSNVLDSLASLGEKIAPRVIAALEDPKRRPKALALVQRMGPQAKQCVPALVKLLGEEASSKADDEEKTMVQILMALAGIGPDAADAVDPIAKSLDDKDAQIAGAACYALGSIGPDASRAVPAITKQLKSASIYTRVSAAWALTMIDKDDARVAKLVLPLLIEALGSDVPLAQVEAAETLGALEKDAKSTLPNLKSLLDHSDGAVATAADQAIKQIEMP